METDILRELHGDLGRGSPARLAFTRRAFEMLPELDKPRILDVGCGQVTGLDVDQGALDELGRRAGEEALSDRIFLVMQRGAP